MAEHLNPSLESIGSARVPSPLAALHHAANDRVPVQVVVTLW